MVILIDTNIFLEHLLAQEKADDCLNAIKTIIDSDINAVISSFSMHSIEVIMLRNRLNTKLREFLCALSDIPHIKVYNTTPEEDVEILDLMDDVKLDFDDTVQAYLAKKLKAVVLTLDKHFDNIAGIKVSKPWEII